MHEVARGNTYTDITSFRQYDETLVNPTSPQAVLTAPSGAQTVIALTLESTGEYTLSWAVAADAEIGTWRYVFRGTYSPAAGLPAELFTSDPYNVDVVLSGTITDDELPEGLYCSAADVRKRAKALDASVASDTDLETCIAFADSQIDSNLVGRYTVPFTTVPPAIRDIAATLAVSRAVREAWGHEGLTVEPEMVKEARQQAEARLKRLRENTEALPDIAQKLPGGHADYDPNGIESLQSYSLFDVRSDQPFGSVRPWGASQAFGSRPGW